MKFFEYNCFKPAPHTFPESKNQSCIWTPVFGQKPQPSQRSHHAVCVCDNQIFMYGGRGVKGTTNQFWVYSFDDSKWEELFPVGDSPPPLEGHTMVVYDENIYIFGGETSFATADESPLWCYNITQMKWTKIGTEGKVMAPCGRRHHTAVLYMDAMCVYGGYQDLIGPTREMWLFDFETKSWHFDVAASCDSAPDARYGHCATVNNQSMWVCGGLTGLKPNADVFIWNFELMVWIPVKTKGGPPVLSYHSMHTVGNSMYVFGGRNVLGDSSNDMWCLNMKDKCWKKCNFNDTVKPPAISGHCLISHFTPVLQKKNEPRTRSLPNVKKKKASLKSTPPTKQRSVSCGKLPNNSQFLQKSESFDAENEINFLDKTVLVTKNCPSEYAYDNPASELSDKDTLPRIDTISSDKVASLSTEESESVNAAGNKLPSNTFLDGSKFFQVPKPSMRTKLHNSNMRYGYVSSRMKHGSLQAPGNGLSNFSYNLIQDSLDKTSTNSTETSFVYLPEDLKMAENVVHTSFDDGNPVPVISHEFPDITTVKPFRIDPNMSPKVWDMEMQPIENEMGAQAEAALIIDDTIESNHIDEKSNFELSSNIAKRFQTQFSASSEQDIVMLVLGGRVANVNPNSISPFCMWQCKIPSVASSY
ncbi:uncharacterized protein LOC120348429 [Styela clava]